MTFGVFLLLYILIYQIDELGIFLVAAQKQLATCPPTIEPQYVSNLAALKALPIDASAIE